MIYRLVHDPIDISALSREVGARDCGALAIFAGTVRDEHQGRRVLRLEYSAYEPMALAQMERIGAEIAARWPVRRIAMVHRLGALEVGAMSIAILLALPHRNESFEALRFAIDTFKSDVPIWKKEYFADGGAEWVLGS